MDDEQKLTMFAGLLVASAADVLLKKIQDIYSRMATSERAVYEGPDGAVRLAKILLVAAAEEGVLTREYAAEGTLKEIKKARRIAKRNV